MCKIVVYGCSFWFFWSHVQVIEFICHHDQPWVGHFERGDNPPRALSFDAGFRFLVTEVTWQLSKHPMCGVRFLLFRQLAEPYAIASDPISPFTIEIGTRLFWMSSVVSFEASVTKPWSSWTKYPDRKSSRVWSKFVVWHIVQASLGQIIESRFLKGIFERPLHV